MTSTSMLFQALFERHGASLDIEDAASHLQFNSPAAARMAVRRGVFPVPVRRRGVRLLVSAADLAAFLSGEAPPSCAAPTPRPAPQPGRKRGRPRKVSPVAKVEEVNHAA